MNDLILTVVLCFYFACNGVIVGLGYNEFENESLWRKFAFVAFMLWSGVIFFILLSIHYYITTFYKEIIKTEISFYWKVYRTTYFQDLMIKNPNHLFEWNQRLSKDKYPNWSNWSIRRLKRHIKILNKKFNYNYEQDLLIRQRELEKNNEWDDE